MNKPIAIWMPGGVGGGYYSQGIPVISKLVDDLSKEYSIDVYSLHPPNADFRSQRFQLFSIDRRIPINWLRWLLLCLLFSWNHFKKKYSLLYAFWGFPAGVIVVGLSRFLRRPSIIHLQGGDAVYLPSINYGSFQGYAKKLMLWAYRHCTILIALTAFQRDKLIEAGLKRNIEVVPFGPDLSLFLPRTKNIDSKPFRFLHVGNLLPVKDQITTLNTFKEITRSVSAQLRIIGEDHQNGLIQEHCEKLNLREEVEFVGIQPYEQMPLHYAWADVLIMTSVYEGQCMAVSEAAASGVFIGGTRVGIIADWGDRSACVVAIADFKSLAEGIIKAIQHPESMRERIEQARQEVVAKDRTWTFSRIREVIEASLSTAQ